MLTNWDRLLVFPRRQVQNGKNCLLIRSSNLRVPGTQVRQTLPEQVALSSEEQDHEERQPEQLRGVQEDRAKFEGRV